MNNRNLVGQLGGAVYYMNKGQNIAREKAASVSNPRSEGQQEQRMRWANMVAFYRANQPWMKRGAFESKKQVWSDYNAFVSANAGVSPVFLTKDEAAQGGAVVAPYIVTKGSLPAVTLISDDGNEQFVSDLYVGDSLTISGSTTAAELSTALLENNNVLREGDQLSFILNIQQAGASVPFIVARYYEFIIDTTDTRTLADLGLEGVVKDDTYEGNECLCILTGGQTCGGALVVSRTISGEIKVSTQALVLNTAMASFLANYTSTAAFNRAAASYGDSEANFLAAGYSGKASNVSVPVGLSILGVSLDNRNYPIGGTAPTNGDGTIMRVTLSEDVTGKTPVISLTGYTFGYGDASWNTNGSLEAIQIQVAGDVISFGVQGEDADQVSVNRIEISIDGKTCIATFQPIDPEVTPA